MRQHPLAARQTISRFAGHFPSHGPFQPIFLLEGNLIAYGWNCGIGNWMEIDVYDCQLEDQETFVGTLFI